MKEKKLTSEEKLNNQLRNFTIEEIESYLELLLTKGLEAAEKEDFQTYNNIEKTLNNSLIIFSSKVRNFNILYNGIKLRVANKFLKKHFNNNSISILEDVSTKGSFLTVEEATKITEAEDYLNYKKAKANIEKPEKADLVENDKYLVELEGYWLSILDKDTGTKITEVEYSGNTEILKAFVEGKGSLLDNDKLIYPVNVEAIANEERILKYKPNTFEIEEFYNFNESFIVKINEYGYFQIIHKTTKSIFEFIEIYNRNIDAFLIQFCDYCLGSQGFRVKEIKNDYES